MSVNKENEAILFFPNYGLKFYLKNEIVESIIFYPTPKTKMGYVGAYQSGLNIYSRNKYTWKYKDLVLNDSYPQDIMEYFGTEGSGDFPLAYMDIEQLQYTLLNTDGKKYTVKFYFATQRIDQQVSTYELIYISSFCKFSK